jgi:predicted XRE-type DNA-binding protein
MNLDLFESQESLEQSDVIRIVNIVTVRDSRLMIRGKPEWFSEDKVNHIFKPQGGEVFMIRKKHVTSFEWEDVEVSHDKDSELVVGEL